MLNKICKLCGNPFEAPKHYFQYCPDCREIRKPIFKPHDLKDHGVAPCVRCGKEFHKTNFQNIICLECHDKEGIIPKRSCVVCGKIFFAVPSTRMLCMPCQRKTHIARVRYSNTIQYRWLRDKILLAFGGSCSLCKKPIKNPSDYHLHHVVPISHGGKDIPENITLLCIRCHRKVHLPKNRKVCQLSHSDTLASKLTSFAG